MLLNRMILKLRDYSFQRHPKVIFTDISVFFFLVILIITLLEYQHKLLVISNRLASRDICWIGGQGYWDDFIISMWIILKSLWTGQMKFYTHSLRMIWTGFNPWNFFSTVMTKDIHTIDFKFWKMLLFRPLIFKSPWWRLILYNLRTLYCRYIRGGVYVCVWRETVGGGKTGFRLNWEKQVLSQTADPSFAQILTYNSGFVKAPVLAGCR